MTLRPATMIGGAGGVVAAGFSVYSMLRPITYEAWDLWNSGIYAAFLTALIAFSISQTRSDATLRDVARELTRAAAIYAAIVIVAYWGTTTYVPNRIVQLPFFIKDYSFHGYVLPAAYLAAGSNYRQLMQLQLLSAAAAAVTQVVAGTSVAFAWRRWAPQLVATMPDAPLD